MYFLTIIRKTKLTSKQSQNWHEKMCSTMVFILYAVKHGYFFHICVFLNIVILKSQCLVLNSFFIATLRILKYKLTNENHRTFPLT